jgi:magnesium chelatase family protein
MPREQRQLQELLRRDHTLFGGVLLGLDGYIIEVQARATEVLPGAASWRQAVSVTGMPRGSVREAWDRIGGAFAKFGIPEPEVKIVINLTPADLPKEGALLDLPMAIIALQAAGVLPDLHESFEGRYILVGEIGLHGDVRRIPGVLSIAKATQAGQNLIVPTGNERECALIMAAPGHEGCAISAVSTIEEVIDFFAGVTQLKNVLSEGVEFEKFIPHCTDIGTILGQERAKQAALIAAAGGHNLLLVGPPGEGKSLLAGAIPGILPPLASDEVVELTRIYSAFGAFDRDGLVVNRRPMRAIHHSASKQSIIGGGSKVPRPGEITLSHLGVLFLDELAEFSSSTLESLRQPMEDGQVRISRVGASIKYPCQFTLVAAMNPCPCGFYGDEYRCRCTDNEVRRYRKKISGPILDRIDLQVDVKALTAEERFSEPDPNLRKEYRQRVRNARLRQDKRFEETGIPFNAAIPGGRIREFCRFGDDAFAFYRKSIEENTLSTRAMDRVAKVSRTVADLYDKDDISPSHVKLATSYVLEGSLRAAFQ